MLCKSSNWKLDIIIILRPSSGGCFHLIKLDYKIDRDHPIVLAETKYI